MKDFLLLSNINAITYKEFFPILKEEKARGGYTFNKTMMFETPEGETKKQTGICWFTTLPTQNKRKLILAKKYKHTEYPHYDNYNAIEVGKVKDIPYDYDCVMGVPITIFGYDLDNMEVVSNSDFAQEDIPGWSGVSQEFYDMYYEQGNTGQIEVGWPLPHYTKDGKAIIPYKRVLIRLKNKNTQLIKDGDGTINGKAKYPRILIRRKQL